MNHTFGRLIHLILCCVLGSGHQIISASEVEGALKVWYPVGITFTGKQASETESTFRDHRLDVTFTKGDQSFLVPGYFAADGNAAESSATEGNKWRVKFTPNEPGVWTYSVSFREGANIAAPAISSPTAGKSAVALPMERQEPLLCCLRTRKRRAFTARGCFPMSASTTCSFKVARNGS